MTIQGGYSRLHDYAFIYYENINTIELTVINVAIDDPFFIDAETPTQLKSRLAGTVIEARRIGLIVCTAVNVTEGDVLISGVGYAVWTSTTAANDDCPSVVMYGSTDASKPCVICIDGITPINNATSVSYDDTMVTHTVAKQATVNNSQTDPKKVIGYIVVVDSTPYVMVP